MLFKFYSSKLYKLNRIFYLLFITISLNYPLFRARSFFRETIVGERDIFDAYLIVNFIVHFHLVYKALSKHFSNR